MAQQKFYRDNAGKFQMHSATADSIQVATLGVGTAAPTATNIIKATGGTLANGDAVVDVQGAVGSGVTAASALLHLGYTRASGLPANALMFGARSACTGHAGDAATATLSAYSAGELVKNGTNAATVGYLVVRNTDAYDYALASGNQDCRILAASGVDTTNGHDVTLTASNASGTGSYVGGDVSGSAGNGVTNAQGGNISFTAGKGGPTGIGGKVLLTAGDGGSSGANGGEVSVKSGNGIVSGVGGPFGLTAGNGAGAAAGGAITITAGTGGATNGAAGKVIIVGGSGGGATGAGGDIELTPGAGSGTTHGTLLISRGSGTQSPTMKVGAVTSQTGDLCQFTDASWVPLLSVDADGDLVWGTTMLTPSISHTASTTGAGAAMTFSAQSSSAGAGGTLDLNAGSATSTAGAGGAISITGGNGIGAGGVGGAAALRGGNATTFNQAGGAATVRAGSGVGTASGGTAQLFGGVAGTNAGAGGAIVITAANGGAGTGGAGGTVTITAGSAGGGNINGANVDLKAGAGAGTGVAGHINLYEGSTLLWSTGVPLANLAMLYSAQGSAAGLAPTAVTSGGGKNAGVTGGATSAASQNGGDAYLDGGAPGSGGAAGYAVCTSNGVATLPKNSRIVHTLFASYATDLTTSFAPRGAVLFLDPDNWPAAKRAQMFTITAKAASAAADDVIQVKLYNESLGADVAGSTVTITDTSWTSAAATISLPGAYAYRVYAKVAGPASTGSNLGSCELRVTYD